MLRSLQEETSSPVNDTRWLVTYTDLISILLNFFVLIFTFSTLHEEDLRKLDGALTGSRSTLKKTNELERPSLKKPRKVMARHGKESDVPRVPPYEAMRRELREKIHGTSMEQVRFELTDDGDGLRVEFPVGATFLPGSDLLPWPLRDQLEQLAPLLSNHDHLFEFAAHASGDFRPTRRFASIDQLCLKRAERAAVAFLAAARKHAPGAPVHWSKIAMTSCADREPRTVSHLHGAALRGAQRRLTIFLRQP